MTDFAVVLAELPDEPDEPDELLQAASPATKHAAAPAAAKRESRTGSSLRLPITVNRFLSTMNDHTFVHLKTGHSKGQSETNGKREGNVTNQVRPK